jgi:hypothetical protein
MSNNKNTHVTFVQDGINLNKGVNLRTNVVPLNSRLSMEGANFKVSHQPSTSRPTTPPVSPQKKK